MPTYKPPVKVFKYPLKREPGLQEVLMPPGVLLSVGLDGLGFDDEGDVSDANRNICVWAAVETGKEARLREIFVVLTGAEAPSNGSFLGTVNDDGYMIHVWDFGFKDE